MFVFKKNILCLLIMILFSQIFSNAQTGNIEFNNDMTRDKLPSNYITDIVQDHDGFIWFSAYGVVAKFDGYRFYQYTSSKETPNSLSSGMIVCLFVDKDGDLWVGTNNGINKYDRHKDNFRYYKNTFSENDLIINGICQDKKGHLWLGTQTGIYVFDPVNSRFLKNYRFDENDTNSIRNNYVFTCFCDKGGDIWFGTRGYLSKYQPEEDNFENYPINQTMGVKTIYEDRNNGFWLGTLEQGLIKFNRSNNSIKSYTHNPYNNKSLSNDNVFRVLEDRKGILWIATENGLNILNGKNEEFEHFFNTPLDNSLVDNHVSCLFLDKTDVLWVGTINGISAIDRQKKQFQNFNYQLDNWTSKNVKSVTGFCNDDKGNLWIGTSSEMFIKYEISEGKITEYSYELDVKKKEKRNNINYIYYADDIVWLGTNGDGVIRFNPEENTFKAFILPDSIEALTLKNEQESSFICQNYIKCIYKDASDNYWISTWNGLNKLKFIDGKPRFTYYKYDPKNLSSISHSIVSYIVEDSKNQLWFGTLGGGLNKLISDRNKKSLKFKSFKNVPGDLTTIRSDEIQQIVEDKSGNLWIGTNSGGLNKLDLSTEKFSSFLIQNKQHNNNVYSIIEDNNGNLWLGSKGLSKFDTKTFEITSYGTEDGILSNFFMANASFRNKDGSVMFGVNNGIIKFHPDSIKKNPYSPKDITITDIKLFNKSIVIDKSYENEILLKKHISETDTISFPYHFNSFTLEFAALHFSNPGTNKYVYTLNGFDKDWRSANSDRRYATYTNLDPGTYEFKVKASNNDNVWNNEGISLTIIIRPPFWLTWWFQLFTILFVCSLVLLIHNIRVRYLKKQQIVLQEMVNARTEELNEANTKLEEHNEEIQEQKEELQNTLEDLQEAQAQLVQSEKMASLGVLTAGLAHEINNPLNFIQGGNWAITEYINENLLDHKELLLPLAGAIEQGVNRAANVINSLRKFDHRNDKIVDKCNIHSIIDNCLTILENNIKYRIEINREQTDKEISFKGNEGGLHQVFLNILTNSVQAIEDKGVIDIKTTIENGRLLIYISDTGKGICQEDLSKITDPFYTTKEPGKGTGLGMSVAYSIIKEHGGTIKYKSELGKGTEVKLSFPLS